MILDKWDLKKDSKYQKELISLYIIKEPLGNGSSSYVYTAKSQKNNKTYALKEIDNKSNVNYKNEINIQKSLIHPNIVKLKKYSINKGKIFILMELCEKGELYTFLKENKSLNEIEIKKISFQLLNALDFIHSKNIIHRDIKLGNIFIKKDQVKIGDFGLSIYKDDTSKNKYTCGTLNYFSPEIINNKIYSNKSDIWALGCVIYALSTGFTPFQSNSKNDTIKNIKEVNINFDIIRNYSANFINFLKSFFIKDFKKRPNTKELLKNKFFNLLIENTISTTDNNEEFKNEIICSKINKMDLELNNSVNHIRLNKSPNYKKIHNLSIFKTIQNKVYTTKNYDLKIKNFEIEFLIKKSNLMFIIRKLKNQIIFKDLNKKKTMNYKIDNLPKSISSYYKFISDILELIENKKNKKIITNKTGKFEINKNNIFPYFKSIINNYCCYIYLKTMNIKIKELNMNSFIEINYNIKEDFKSLDIKYQQIITLSIKNYNILR